MATVQIILLTTKEYTEKKHPVVLRLTIDRKRKYYFIGDGKGYSCTIEQWDNETNRFKKNFPDYKLKNQIIDNKQNEAKNILLKAELDNEPLTFVSFEKSFFDPISKKTIRNLFESEINRLKSVGNYNYAELYKVTQKVILDFYDNKELKFTDIDYNFLKNFETHCYTNGLKGNSISVYMRTFKTLFNTAIKTNICKEENYPFKSRNNPNGYGLEHLKQETQKRAISIEQMRAIKNYETKEGTLLFHSKNYFLFSFYCMGMNFKDMAYLKWSDINNGRIEYRRDKTGKLFSIKIQPETNEIIEYYRQTKNSDYVFPIINPEYSDTKQCFNRIKKVLKQMNENLRVIAKAVGIDFNITSYVARHSWATIQYLRGTSEAVISEGLGHQTVLQTHTYLKKFENTVLDNANENLL